MLCMALGGDPFFNNSGLDGDAVNKMHKIIRAYGGISDNYRVSELGKDMFIAHISSVPVCGKSYSRKMIV